MTVGPSDICAVEPGALALTTDHDPYHDSRAGGLPDGGPHMGAYAEAGYRTICQAPVARLPDRRDGARLLEAIGELIEIARAADIRAEVYHLKAAWQANWPLFPKRCP